MSSFRDDIEILKFMIDKHNEEARLYWIGMNVFFAINVGALSYVAAGILETKMHCGDSLAAVSVVGALLSVTGSLVALRQEYHFRRWKDDAWNLAVNNELLLWTFKHFFRDKIKEMNSEKNHKKDVKESMKQLGLKVIPWWIPHSAKVIRFIPVGTFSARVYIFTAYWVECIRLGGDPKLVWG